MTDPFEIRILVTGDRNWKPVRLATRVLTRLKRKLGDTLVLVHGDAEGVDGTFARVAESMGIATEGHPADWEDLDRPNARVLRRKDGTPYNAQAGPDRNQEMIQTGIEYCIAVHRYLPKSKGTKDCVTRCLRAGIPVYLIDSEDAEPKRIRWV